MSFYETCFSCSQAFLVLNIPTPEHLDALSSIRPETLAGRLAGAQLRCIYYFLGERVLADSRLSSFMEPFSKTVHHRISSPDIESHNPVTFVHSALLGLRMRHLDDKIFSVPQYSFSSRPSLPADLSFPPLASPLSPNARFSQTHVPIAPESGVEYRHFNFDVPSDEATLEASRLKGFEKTELVRQAASDAWDKFVVVAARVKSEVEAEEHSRLEGREQDVVAPEVKVTPLGTGSAIPSKYRNVSSTLVHVPPASSDRERGSESSEELDDPVESDFILLDTGEGTWGQLERRFGSEGARRVLRGIKLISISHMHQDHHAGLTRIMQERARVSQKDQIVCVNDSPTLVSAHSWTRRQKTRSWSSDQLAYACT